MKTSKSKRGRPPKPANESNKTKSYSFKPEIAAFLETRVYPARYISELIMNHDPDFETFLDSYKNGFPPARE